MGVRGEPRLAHQRLHTAQTGRMDPHFQTSHEAVRRLRAPEQLEREHAAEAVERGARNLVILMIRQAGVVDVADLFPTLRPRRNARRILVLSTDTYVECLQAAVEQPDGEWVWRLSPHHHLLPYFLDVGRGTRHDTRHHIVMAIEILRARVDDDVRAMLERAE